MKSIKVYGPGCAKCEDMTTLVKEVSRELGLKTPVEKITDILQFAVAGVIVTPALVIDGKVAVSGRVPTRDEMRSLLHEAAGDSSVNLPVQDTVAKETQETSCECGGCCETMAAEKSSPPQKGSLWQRLIVWAVVILIAVAAIKLANRKAKQADAAANATTTADVAALKANRVDVVYYRYGTRCATCARMEQWACEAVTSQFKDEANQGVLFWNSVPASQEDVNRYGLTSKSIVVKSVRDGTETTWKNLDRIWDLSGDEAAFKQYVAQGIRDALGGI